MFHNPHCHCVLLTQKRGRWMEELMPTFQLLQTGKRPKCPLTWLWFIWKQRRKEEKEFKVFLNSSLSTTVRDGTTSCMAHSKSYVSNICDAVSCWHFWAFPCQSCVLPRALSKGAVSPLQFPASWAAFCHLQKESGAIPSKMGGACWGGTQPVQKTGQHRAQNPEISAARTRGTWAVPRSSSQVTSGFWSSKGLEQIKWSFTSHSW